MTYKFYDFFTFHSSADRLPVDECLIIYVVDNLIQDFYNQALLYGIEISVGRVIGIVGKRRREIVFIVFRIRILYFDSDRQPVGGCDFIFLDIDGPLALLGDLAFETNISVVIGQLTQACFGTHVICQFLGKQRT